MIRTVHTLAPAIRTYAVLLVAGIALTGAAQAAELYVSYFYENTVHRFDATTRQDLGVFASTGGSYQRALAFDSNRNLYVSSYDETVYKFNTAGALIGRLDTTSLTNPRGLAVDKSDNLYVANNDRILKFGPDGADLGSFASVAPLIGSQATVGLAFDGGGNLYAAVAYRGIAKFSPSGALLDWFGEDIHTDAGPQGLAIDRNGNIYAAYYWDDSIQKFAPNGSYLGTFANTGLKRPMGLAFDLDGNLYVGNTCCYGGPYENSIHKFGPNGEDLGIFAKLGTGAITGPEWLAFAPEPVPETSSLLLAALALAALTQRLPILRKPQSHSIRPSY